MPTMQQRIIHHCSLTVWPGEHGRVIGMQLFMTRHREDISPYVRPPKTAGALRFSSAPCSPHWLQGLLSLPMSSMLSSSMRRQGF